MTMRDELIKAAARAIEGAIPETSFDWTTDEDGTMQLLGPVNRNALATAALDAILERMEEPDEAMLYEFARSFGWAGHTPAGKANAKHAVKAMLATIRSPKI